MVVVKGEGAVDIVGSLRASEVSRWADLSICLGWQTVVFGAFGHVAGGEVQGIVWLELRLLNRGDNTIVIDDDAGWRMVCLPLEICSFPFFDLDAASNQARTRPGFADDDGAQTEGAGA